MLNLCFELCFVEVFHVIFVFELGQWVLCLLQLLKEACRARFFQMVEEQPRAFI